MLWRTSGHAAFGRKLRPVLPNIVSDIAQGLLFLREHHVRMWGLHPRNVMLDPEMNVKLTDYGRSPQVLDLTPGNLDRHDQAFDKSAVVSLRPMTHSGDVRVMLTAGAPSLGKRSGRHYFEVCTETSTQV